MALVPEHSLRDNNLVLLVEDNPDDRDLALIAFQKSSVAHEVVVCDDGQSALDFLFARGSYSGRDARAMPRLVLLDIKLPRLDGIEVLKQVRADHRTRTLPVVILSSSREYTDVLQCYEHHANSYIRKPVDFDRFIETARQILVYWLEVNEPPAAR